MPELPEVETTRRGIEPHTLGKPVNDVIIRQRQLRWSIPKNLKSKLLGRPFVAVRRRAKYLLLDNAVGTLLIHLGMSGSLRVHASPPAPGKHDHVDIVFDDGSCLRLTDPRRFGAVLWLGNQPQHHELLNRLGPEPLDEAFNAEHLYTLSRKRKAPIKNFIMDGHVVVGVGNIYASEALFRAGIRPQAAAGSISRERYARLTAAIKAVLAEAIQQGGTTLRDFIGGDGKPGYFKQQLSVYGREGEACLVCGATIKNSRIGQRSSFYCSKCQR